VTQIVLSDSALSHVKVKIRLDGLEHVEDHFKNLMVSGIVSTYKNMPDLDSAAAMFDSLLLLRPDRPEGYFCKAALFSALYQLKPTAAVFDSLKLYTDKTIDTTKSLLKQYPDDKYLYLYLGGVYGNIGLYYLVRKNYWDAYINGRRGKRYLEEALEIDPLFPDAQFGLGIFQYYADVLTKYIKPLLYIVGFGGDRKKGIVKIKNAAAHSYLSQVEAQHFLMKIYGKYEGKPHEARLLLNNLLEQFPDNFFLRYSQAKFYYENGYYGEFLDSIEKLLQKSEGKSPLYSRNLHYFYGVILNVTGDYEKSSKVLLKAGSYGRFTKDMAAERFFRIGLDFELLGRRNSAVEYYVLAKQAESNRYSGVIKKHIEKPLDTEERSVYDIDNLLNKGLYREAEKKSVDSYRQINNTIEKSGRYYGALFTLQHATSVLRQGRVEEAETVFISISEKTLNKNNEFLARYYLLGAEINMALNNAKDAEFFISKTKKIDRDDLLPVFHRKILFFQRKIFGNIKFR